jgi:hypothetical protein
MLFRRSKQVTTQELAEGLVELHVRLSASGAVEQDSGTEGQFVLPGTALDRSLALGAMYMLAFTQVAHSEALPDSGPLLQDLGRRLRQGLLGVFLSRADSELDAQALVSRFDGLCASFLGIWNESVDKQPCPQHYVAKRAQAFLSGGEDVPDIACVGYLAHMLFGYANVIKDLLDDVIEKFGVRV